jgi:hypothetical protein
MVLESECDIIISLNYYSGNCHSRDLTSIKSEVKISRFAFHLLVLIAQGTVDVLRKGDGDISLSELSHCIVFSINKCDCMGNTFKLSYFDSPSTFY